MRYILLLLTLTMLGCSADPSSSDVEKLIEQKREAHNFNSFSTMTNFNTANGEQKAENLYEIDVSYDLTYQKSRSEYIKMINQEVNEFSKNNDKETTRKRKRKADKELRLVKIHHGHFKKDDKTSRKKRIFLIKDDGKWRIRMGF